ncbi:MAG: hypothetical protein AAGA77_03735 [Bacteroidota bacterium]
MESLFKFILRRPPVKKEENMFIDLSQETDYQADLATSIGKENAREILKAASEKFIQTSNFIKKPSEVVGYEKTMTFIDKLNELDKKGSILIPELRKAVEESFGMTVSDTLKSDAYLKAIETLKDSILAIKHLPQLHQKPIEELSNLLRDLEIVRKISEDAKSLKTGLGLKKYRNRPFKLPTKANLKSTLKQKDEERKQILEAEKRRQKEKIESVREKASLYRKLDLAVKEIMKLDTEHLESTIQSAHEGFMPPKELRPLAVFAEEIQKQSTLGQLQILNAKTLTETTKGINTAFLTGAEAKVAEVKKPPSKQFYSGVGEFRPISNLSSQFRFRPGTERLLSKESSSLLNARNFDITKTGIDKIVAELKFEMEELSSELELLTQNETKKSIKRIGNTLLISSSPKVSMWGHMTSLDDFNFFNIPSLDFRIPRSKGSVAPSGWADLIIVKQHLKKYQGKEVAHIENVLRGELKERTHRRLNRSVEDNFSETEVIKIEERELESTDRFELSREASEIIKVDASLKAGLSVSGSYGPTVSFSASAEGSLSTSKEEATKSASSFSKDVTQRSVDKITERILSKNRFIVTNEVEETNNHSLNNVGDGAHISGIYQWVEKVYEAQMYNYGGRMMFDFMVPEPGAFLVETMQKPDASVMVIEPVTEFSLQPNQINERNYNYWIHKYAAKGIVPPPEEYITKSLDFNAGGGDSRTHYRHSGIIQIDEGYKAIYASVAALDNIWNGNASIDVAIGRRTHRFKDNSSWVWSSQLNNEADSIPFAMKTHDVSDIALAVRVKCQRTSRAYKKWQLDTHAKLMDAYQAKLADYEERLAALEMQAGVGIEGKNPALNLEMMKDELKKNCITILTDQHFELFDAIENGSTGLPQIDLYQNEAEGPYVRFFEQAFEWEHITWLTYPYFWGRKSKWEERISFDDPDPLFNQFIKAGYCRVVVPVRLGFEGAIDHFMTFGEIWEGGPLPIISSELYLPIADELAERLDRPGQEIPQGDPWEVRIPTNLVKLRQDDKLPQWEKNEDGEWIES